MEDKKSWVAVVVSILFILFYTETVLQPYMQQGKPTPHATQQAPAVASQPSANPSQAGMPSSPGAATSVGTAPSLGATTTAASSNQPDWRPSLRPHPTLAEIMAAPTIAVETENYNAKISTLGGRIVSFTLKGYKTTLGAQDAVDLVHATPSGLFPGGLYFGSVDDSQVRYTLNAKNSTGENCVAREESQCLVTLTGSLQGTKIEKSFSFKGNTFLVDVTAATDGSLSQTPSILEWSHWVTADESHQRLNPLTFKVLTEENKVETTTVGEEQGGVTPFLPAQWVSVEGRYFLASLLPSVTGPNGYTIHEIQQDGTHILYGRIAGAPAVANFKMFLGPKDSQILERTGFQLHRNIDLGYFSFLAFPLLWLLRFFESLLGNYGLGIIALTLLIKTCFLPLTMVSFRSARAMQDLQPEIKALRERITDPNQLNQEMLALYKKRGVNPMGGCFPVLIQVPVFIGLYNALLNAIELRHAPFALWIQDLSAPEQFMIFGFPVQLMVIILGVSMFVQQVMTPTPGMEPLQRKMLLAMPIVLSISFLVYPLPAGLVLYWIVNNTISIVQQLYIKRELFISPMQATLLAGAVILALGYLLTLI